MPQYPAAIDLAALDGTNGYRLDGEGPLGAAGWAVHAAGDVNGDGFADVVIGAPAVVYGAASHAGAAYVVFGSAASPGAVVALSSLSAGSGFKIVGADPTGYLGGSITSADVNGDGFSDIVVASPGQPYAYDQTVSVVFGKASGLGPVVDASALSGPDGFTFNIPYAIDRFGAGVAAGDLNGDGFGDLIVTTGITHVFTTTGQGFVVSGHAAPFSATETAATDLGSWKGTVFDQEGSASGDINGDGIADLVIGSPESFGHYLGMYGGSVYVAFGARSGLGPSFNLSAPNGTDGFVVKGAVHPDVPTDIGDHIGSSVGVADVNGDGFADVIFSADPGAFVIFGKATGFAPVIDIGTMTSGDGLALDGAFGFVAALGDANGDGIADVGIGRTVLFGKTSGFGQGLDLSNLAPADGFKVIDTAPSPLANRETLVGAGDVNGDGLDDLLVGAPYARPNGAYSGAAYIVYGRLPDTAVNRTGTAASQALVGGNSDDVLTGLGGDDRLFGHGGNDTIDGGTGDDTAVYFGDRSDYLISTSGGVTVVHDTRTGSPDGTDSLTHVEHLKFADQAMTLGPADAPPVANADAVSTAYAHALAVSAASLLANDGDPDGDALSLTGVSGAQHGTVRLAGGIVTFTPFLGFAGQAGFDYAIDDGKGGVASAHVTVNVTGSAPTYLYRAGLMAADTIDFTGDGAMHQLVTGQGDTTVLTGPGGSSVSLGAGHDVVIGGSGKDTITFGAGLDTVTGGAGPDAFILAKGRIADPAAHGGQYDTVTDFTGAGAAYAPGRDFIWLKGFATTSTVTYEHDLAGDPTAHLYRIDDGGYHAEFVLQYAAPGLDLVRGQFGFL